MICPNCKNEIKENETSCSNCGAIVGMPKKTHNTNFEGIKVDDYTVHLDKKYEDDRDNVNQKALISSIVSIMSLFLFGFTSIIGIIFGIIALKEIKTKNQNGKKLAIAGIVVGIFSLIAYIALFIIYS